MKSKTFNRLILTVALILAVFPSFQVQAKDANYPDLYLELNVPDDTVILTKDTPNTDNGWAAAGITDIKSEKDSFSSMGVKAIFFDPETKTIVRLIRKQSSKTKEIFHLSLLSEEKQKEFFDSLTSNSDPNVKNSIEKYPQQEIPFFRYSVELTKDGIPMKELIYGTIANGFSISFDIYQKGSTKPLDESFIKELVGGAHFTKFLDKAEVERQEKQSVLFFTVTLILLAVIIIIWVFIRKNKNKKLNLIKEKKSKALVQFYTEQKQKEEQNKKDRVLFVNRTQYTQDIVKDFCYYNELLKKLKMWITAAVLFIILLAYLYFSGSALIGCTIAIVLLFVFIYYQGIRIEKLISRTMKGYDKNKSMEAVFTFYENYFTLSGIQYISKFPYLQITEIKEYKDNIYIYLGSDKAFYLKKNGFEQGSEEFIKFIKQNIE